MTVLVAGAVWAGLIAWLLLRILRQFRTHRAASLSGPMADTAPPDIAIIVPARNEIANIATCLAVLTAQRGEGARRRSRLGRGSFDAVPGRSDCSVAANGK